MCFAHIREQEKRGLAVHSQGACSQRRCGKCPRAKWQRGSSEDRRTPVLFHTRFVLGHVAHITQVAGFSTLSRQSEVHVPTNTVL